MHMPIRIYNYAESKLPMTVKLVSNYYLDTNWHKGPLIGMSKESEKLVLEDIKQCVNKYYINE